MAQIDIDPLTHAAPAPILVPHVFGSVIFLLDNEVGDTDHVDRASEWLDKWLAWFLQWNGVLQGRNLHQLYDRSVSVLGSSALQHADKISQLAAVAAAHGATFAAELQLAGCVRMSEAYTAMLAAGWLKSILFNPSNWPADAALASGLDVVEAAARSGAALIFLGSPTFWAQLGALDSPIVNAANFRIVPGHRPLDDAPGVGQVSVRQAGGSTLAFSPCDTRFAVYVTSAGEIYPCLGLVGCRKWRMGTIHQQPQDTGFATEMKVNQLQAWADKGPELEDKEPAPDAAHLPIICAVHRRLVKEADHEPHSG